MAKTRLSQACLAGLLNLSSDLCFLTHKASFQLAFARTIGLGPSEVGKADASCLCQGPSWVCQMGSGNRTQVGPTCRDDAVDMVGLADGSHGNGANACLLANAVSKWCLKHTTENGGFFFADLPR